LKFNILQSENNFYLPEKQRRSAIKILALRMINSSSNFKDDTFGKDHGGLGNTLMNSNPFMGGILDSSFNDKVMSS
jgi:hypothetical protein